MKTLFSTLILSTLLCAPVFADTSKTVLVGFSLGAGKDARHYRVQLVPDDCGKVEAKAAHQSDHIKVCVHPDGKDFRVQIEWETRSGTTELRNHSTVVAARGGTFDVDGGTAKLNVTVN